MHPPILRLPNPWEALDLVRMPDLVQCFRAAASSNLKSQSAQKVMICGALVVSGVSSRQYDAVRDLLHARRRLNTCPTGRSFIVNFFQSYSILPLLVSRLCQMAHLMRAKPVVFQSLGND